MKIKKGRPVKNLDELRYKMAEKMAEFENGEITAGDAKIMIGFGGVIMKGFQVEIMNNAVSNVKSGIDFIIEAPKALDEPK
jgi:hypothetical protein